MFQLFIKFTQSKSFNNIFFGLQMRNEGLTQVIRYEQQIKQKIQAVDNSILQGGRSEAQLRQLNDLIQQEDILIKYLEVESSKMSPEVRNLYSKNLTRFKKKIKEHKEYFHAYFGVAATKQDAYNVRGALEIQRQTNELFNKKMVMYENQRLQGTIGHNVQAQGQILQRGIQANQQIRREAGSASDAIKLIQRSILKRKFMFYSIFVLFGLAVAFIVLKKVFK